MRGLGLVAGLGILLLALVVWLIGSGWLHGHEAALPQAASQDAGIEDRPLLRGEGAAAEPTRVALEPDGPTASAGAVQDLRGRTVDPAGAPIEGVEISLRDEAGERSIRSDEEGRFQVDVVERLRSLEVGKPGWTLLREPESLRPRTDGTWPELEWVLTPTATLRVSVRDASGRPVQGVELRAGISPAERFGFDRSRRTAFRPQEARAESGADGLARLEQTPARQRLVLRVRAPGADLELEHERGGLAVAASAPGTTPIVLEPGAVAELRVDLASRLRIHGRVLGPDRAPAPARVMLRLVGPPLPDASDPRAMRTTDEDGRFDFELVPAVTPARVLVSAQGTRGEKPSYSPFGGTKLPDPLHCAWSLVHPAGNADEEHELTLTLAPTLAIAGTVTDALGEGVDVRIELVPRQGDHGQSLLATGRPRTRDLHGPGGFRFTGVPPGLYDVVVSSSQRADVEIPAVPAGTQDLNVRLEGEPSARVTIEVAADLELAQVIVLSARLHPAGEPSLEVEPLPEQAVYAAPLGWPETALGLWYGAQRHTDDLGDVLFASWPIQGDSVTLERAQGLYWFGAKAQTSRGLYCFPVGTGLVRLEAGEHRLRFELSPAGALEGRVVDAAPQAGLWVALALPDGRLVPLDVRRARMSELVELGADGWFGLASVPCGALELRLGTPDELRAGRWRRSLPVVVRPGETTRVELGP